MARYAARLATCSRSKLNLRACISASTRARTRPVGAEYRPLVASRNGYFAEKACRNFGKPAAETEVASATLPSLRAPSSMAVRSCAESRIGKTSPLARRPCTMQRRSMPDMASPALVATLSDRAFAGDKLRPRAAQGQGVLVEPLCPCGQRPVGSERADNRQAKRHARAGRPEGDRHGRDVESGPKAAHDRIARVLARGRRPGRGRH